MLPKAEFLYDFVESPRMIHLLNSIDIEATQIISGELRHHKKQKIDAGWAKL